MDANVFRRFFTRNPIFFVFLFNLTQLAQTDVPNKLRLCMVASRDTSTQVSRLCSELESAEGSGVSCSLAPDRLTCLRRVSKDKADFATFQVEDILVAARRNVDDLAVTNQLRAVAKPLYEYDVVAVVRNSANISTLSQLRNSSFCHPGFGYETDWTGVVSRFLEARVVPQRCDASMTLIENSLNSSADFFRHACKAGPWVPDPDLDAELKSRYSSLCALCDNPDECSTLDKYWGRVGPLFCLTDGAGDVLWARLDHIRTHFAPEDPNNSPRGLMTDYSFLCPDGSVESLEILRNKSSRPCVWISRPWPVVIANRRVADQVQNLVKNLAIADSGSWKRALLLLVAPLQQHTPATKTITTPEETLGTASGWLNAATINPCGIDGSPIVCVNSATEGSKCQWLSEAARSHGVRGAPFCKTAHHFKHSDCLRAVARGHADMTIVKPDQLLAATREHKLKTLLYERPDRSDDLYLVTAVVTDIHHWTLGDLRGKRACFPSYNGASWKLVVAGLRSKGMIPPKCGDVEALNTFFSWYCVNQGNGSVPLCPDADVGEKEETADSAALRCLAVGHGDVAFIDKSSLNVLESGVNWARNYHAQDFHFVCFVNLKQGCHIGWAPHGMLMVRTNTSVVKLRQWRTMLERLDEIFGPNHRTPTPAMQMFGPFDSRPSIIFHNSTRELVDYETLTQDTASYALDFIKTLREDEARCPSSGHRVLISFSCLLLTVFLNV